ERGASRTEYAVATDSGTLRITGALDELTSGSAFTGTLALPESFTRGLDGRYSSSIERAIENPIDSRSLDGQSLTRLAQAEQQPLPVATARVELAESTFGTAAHTVDVAVVSGGLFSDTAIDANVTALANFWVGQSAGAITS